MRTITADVVAIVHSLEDTVAELVREFEELEDVGCGHCDRAASTADRSISRSAVRAISSRPPMHVLVDRPRTSSAM
ncbi:hypothetical protein BBK82_35730 [Lentzea guizhouensis]|uniref:Uncharacterized protein n=1 Tax=Lentzea guizhouensis TaxID=1586287 RepID=A0A1B2HS65_9PSEU|nr:hypothetical protein [Lentzea guizhouensis]ANZ40564.1 hypothetical protein BBK82_35730 [Lentzea guizhouensis]